MASFLNPSAATAPPQVPYPGHISMPLSVAQLSAAEEEAVEWEYEYSATEMETYYLTLDLTTPSTTSESAQFPKAGRGGYKPTWINPGRRREKRELARAPKLSLPKVYRGGSLLTPTPTPANFGEENIADDDEVSNNVEVDGKDDLIENETEDPATITKESKPEKIQILDLHTDNPMITYKEHIFSCSWAENIGTELLFTFHDHDNPLPVVRSLPDDVDLLAASSARITSKSITLAVNHGFSDGFESDGPRSAFGHFEYPTPRRGRANSSRKTSKTTRMGQANFLERVMEIKQSKGENDGVTIVSQKRLFPSQWGAVWKQKRGEEREELQFLIQGGGQKGQHAAIRLAEMSREDSAREEMEKLKKETQSAQLWKAGRKSKIVEGHGSVSAARGSSLFRRRPRGGRGGKVRPKGSHDDSGTLGQASAGQDIGGVSDPTPERWGDLHHRLGYDNEDDEMADVIDE